MKSFLPAVFRPNRQHRLPPLSVTPLRDHVDALRVAFQNAARSNLDALLAGMPPVALGADVFMQVFDVSNDDPLAGYELADWRAGKLPDESFAMRLLQEPGRSGAIATLQSVPGLELLMPRLLDTAWRDGAFRHDLAQTCRHFLCERVLFHPGPPPQALFSPAAIAVLCLSQPDQIGSIAGRAPAALRSAARQLQAASGAALAWDQWLYRRMDESAGWHLSEDLATLPWVTWRRGDPTPGKAEGAERLDYWQNLIDLDL